jgi:hypothetical protein
MVQKRLLLPFTWGIDEQAIDNVLRFAKASEVTLVALALIPVADQYNKENVRPERVQQARDFLEMIAARASFYTVAVEGQECFTSSILISTWKTLQKEECQGVLMITKEQEPCLLKPNEATQIQNTLNVNFYNLHIPARKKAKKKLLWR